MNPRRRFDGPAFDELLASVREKGVIQPIVVRPLGNGNQNPLFEIVAGERRWRASMKAAKEKQDRRYIPAIIRDLDDNTAFEIMTIENLQREDLTELEEATSFKTYLDRKGVDSIEDLALKVGTTAAYIRRRVSVLGLPEQALALSEEGKLKFGHLALLVRLGDRDKGLSLFVNSRTSSGCFSPPARSPRSGRSISVDWCQSRKKPMISREGGPKVVYERAETVQKWTGL